MARSIPPLDLMFLLGESRDSPAHVGGLMIFEPPGVNATWTVADLVRHYRAAKPLPPFDTLPQLSLLDKPRWVPVGEIDPNYHVQHVALPAPAKLAQLHDLVQQWHGEMLDRRHPLFQVFVIEGIEGGRFAIYAKIHHALVDGASAIMRVLAGFSADPKAPLGAPFFAVEMKVKRRRAPRVDATNLSQAYSSLLVRAKSLRELSHGIWKKVTGGLLGESLRGSLPFGASPTLFNVPVRSGRAFAHLTLPMAPLRAAGKNAQGTLNDAVLAVFDVAVGKYLCERGAVRTEPLSAMVPVSLREAGDQEAGTKVSAVVARLGDPGANVHAVLNQVVERMNDAKAEIRTLSKADATNYAIGIYVAALGLGGAGMRRPLANFIVSNVPGTETQMYLGDARLIGIYPASLLATRMGLNVTLVSHAGQLDIGLTAHRGALPDPQRLADLCLEAYAALLAPNPSPPAVPVKKTRKAATPKVSAEDAAPRHRSTPAKKTPLVKRSRV